SGNHTATSACRALSAHLWPCCASSTFIFSTATSPTRIYTLSLHDALPISHGRRRRSSRGDLAPRAAAHRRRRMATSPRRLGDGRSEEHTSELQSLRHLVCRLLLEKKKKSANMAFRLLIYYKASHYLDLRQR